MTEKQIKQIKAQLPQGEHIDRMYSAYEGGIRVITKKKDGTDYRRAVAEEWAIIGKGATVV